MSGTTKAHGITLEALPAEIRNLIYTFAVVEDGPLVVWKERRLSGPVAARSGRRRVTHECRFHPQVPALAMTSKAAQHDALPIWYSANTFLLTYTADEAWLVRKSNIPSRCPISNVIIEFDCLLLSEQGGLHGRSLGEIYLKMGSMRQIAVAYGGAMTRMCTCVEEDIKGLIMERDPADRSLISFAVIFEITRLARLKEAYLDVGDEVCERCGKHKLEELASN